MPFKQYIERNETAAFSWTENDIQKLINKAFPGDVLKANECITRSQITKQEKCCPDSLKNISDTIEKTSNNYDLTGNKAMTNRLFQMKSSKEYWEQLSISAYKKKPVTKKAIQWKQNYLNVLPLHNNSDERNVIYTDISSAIQCSNSLNSDDSDSEHTEEMIKICDPIYSRFGEIRDVFHTSEDGIVFYTQKELDKYKVKMAGLKEVLHSELEIIRHQHDYLKKAQLGIVSQFPHEGKVM
ncbi:hypothetical protein AC249_AIPGENE4003 [Exaiptasia diaphana]|nr:hypothetical protein AC249_AIPGENE4003 [Exaiptasia diaphana]